MTPPTPMNVLRALELMDRAGGTIARKTIPPKALEEVEASGLGLPGVTPGIPGTTITITAIGRDALAEDRYRLAE